MMKEGRKELPRLRDDSVSVYRAVGRSENPGGGGGAGGSTHCLNVNLNSQLMHSRHARNYTIPK